MSVFQKGPACKLLLKDEQFFKLKNNNSLYYLCALTVQVIWSRKSLPNISVPECFANVFLSFIIGFAWLVLSKEPTNPLILLWYYVVLLVCPTRSTICWNEFSKSSMVKSVLSSGAVLALSRACRNYDRGPITSIFLFWFFEILCLRFIPKMGRWDIILGLLVKIDSFKSCSCTYWLKYQLEYFAVSSGKGSIWIGRSDLKQ